MNKSGLVDSHVNGRFPHPLKVLFISPPYPNIFCRVMEELTKQPGLSIACMVENRAQEYARASAPTFTLFSYEPDAEGMSAYAPVSTFERGARKGLGIARALQLLKSRYNFDVIVGDASNGCSLYLRQAVDSAIVSFCWYPNASILNARAEFPITFDQYVSDIAYQALILPSFEHSELGVVASEHARSLFPKGLQSKIRVQSEGVDLPRIKRDKSSLRKQQGLPNDGPLIGFFGRSLESVRGFDIFLLVAKEVLLRRAEVNVVVIGSQTTLYGNEQRYLGETSFKQYAMQKAGFSNEEIIWRDFLPYSDFIECLQALDLAILPTFEGASNWSFFDAMASSVAIISANRSYVPELINSGENGYLLDPYDIEGFVNITLKLLDDEPERRRIGHAARQRIEKSHTHVCAARGYEKIIREAYRLRQQHNQKVLSRPRSRTKVKSSEVYSIAEGSGLPRHQEDGDGKLAQRAISLGAMQKPNELYQFIQFMKDRKLKTIVEIGTARGGMFWLLCQLAHDNAKLVSIDLPGGNFGGGCNEEDVERMKGYLRRGQKAQFIRMDSKEAVDSLKKVIDKNKIDLLFIDGDHTYEGVKSDYELYSPLVAKDGCIAFHDIVYHPTVPDCRVHKFWNEIKDESSIEFIDLNGGEWAGIGIMDRSDEEHNVGRRK